MKDCPEDIELRRMFGDRLLNRRRAFRLMGRLVCEQHGPGILAGDAASICREAAMQEAKAGKGWVL